MDNISDVKDTIYWITDIHVSYKYFIKDMSNIWQKLETYTQKISLI